MRRLLFTFSAAWLVLLTLAQSPKEEFEKNLRLSGSNFVAYPGPQQRKLTPSPRGKHPFYISHYGRHGSRHQTSSNDYDYAYDVLLKADSEKALSQLGRDVLQRLKTLRAEASGRWGDLTPLGAQQQRGIAHRMFERFPEVFEGEAVIDARSSTTPRCILSMAYFVEQLVKQNSRLTIHQDASDHDRYYMRGTQRNTPVNAAKDSYDDFCNRHPSHQRVVSTLFADTAYMNHYVNAERLNFYLFRLASNLQSSELRKDMTLYDLFNDQEIYENWLKENAMWFLAFGFTDLNGGNIPYSQGNLLRNIITQADSCLLLPNPGCTLRFGHDTVLLPLVCLLDLNGYGQKINDIDQLERKGWLSYRIFPMACNVQFIFYRANAADKDVLFKVLLNENEATLPLKTNQAPYYHWDDFRQHYLKLLDDYENRNH